MKTGDRTVGAVVFAVGGVGFLVASALLVPWSPVPGGAPDAVSAASVFAPEQVERAESFAWWARVWSWSSLAVHLVAVSVAGFTHRGRRLFARLPGRWFVQVVLAVALLEIGLRVLTLPFAAAAHEHRLDHGLSTQSWSAWVRDVAVGQAVSITATSIGLVVVLGAARHWRRAWPAVVGLCMAALVVAGSWLYPVVVEPLFNSFTPLPAGPLRTQILEVAEREGVSVDDVLVADASRRTTSLNAYVSGLDLPGLGETRRVVVYDTLVESLPQDQALSVVAHEIAHARHDDVLIGTALGALGLGAASGLLPMLLGRRRQLGEAAAVPLLVALVAWGGVVAAPVENGISRRIETRADVDALKATGDPVAFGEMQKMLALRALADPTPPAWSQWWWGSHPTVLERLALTG